MVGADLLGWHEEKDEVGKIDSNSIRKESV
jgi:hypothetical protein